MGKRRKADQPGTIAGQPQGGDLGESTADLSHIVEQLRPLAVGIDSLKLDPRNARKHGEKNLASIVASLRAFGQRRPIVVNRINGEVEAGNGTLLAARELGWQHIAAVYVDDDPATQTGFAIADNRTAELAEWDDAVLQDLLLDVENSSPTLYDALLLAELEANQQAAPPGAPAVAVPEFHGVVVDCGSEAKQRQVFEQMQTAGYKCRLQTM